jgi:phospholipase/lecithinase/hemolysin
MAALWVFGPAVLPAQTAFTSLYVFGDGVSTTTNNNPGGGSYYQHRFCNGRVWVEVLAQRQGLPIGGSNNCSYFGQSTTELLKNINKFTPPADVATALFVVWVCDADLVNDIISYENAPGSYSWNNAINQSQANLQQAIQNLYAMGARTLIMPNAVDLTKVPYYSGSGGGNVIRQAITNYNTALNATVSNAQVSFPDLVIYEPDFFSLLDDISAHSANYGLTNPDTYAIALYSSITNPVAVNYVFWDWQDPTAKTHMWMADMVQQLLSPAQITHFTRLGASNQLDMASIPIGEDGFVEASSNLVSWATAANIDSTNLTQSILVPAAGPLQFYRLRFPFSWTWP